MIEIEAITDFNALSRLQPEWNECLEKSAVDFPFLTFEWISCWWQSYGGGSELFVLLAREQGELVGIAPLMKTRISHRGLRLRAITFIANYHSNRSGFILSRDKKEVLAAMIDYARSRQNGERMFLLDFLPQGSENEQLLAEVLGSRRMKRVTMPSLISPYITIDRTWEEYLKGRSKKFRSRLNYTGNRYLKIGGALITCYSDKEIDRALDELLQVSRKTWKFREGTAIASNEENTSFYRSLAQAASAKGWLNIWVLKVKNRPIAFAYHLVYHQKVLVLKIGFDEEFSKDSTGEFLSMNAIADAFETDMAEFDWLGDNNPYKLSWASAVRVHVKYLVFNDSLYGRLLYFMEHAVIPLVKKMLRARPPQTAITETPS